MVSGAPPRAGEEWSLPQLRDFLERFRPAGAPGAAAGAGVPADRSRELAARQAHRAALAAAVRHAAAAEAERVIEAETVATRHRLRAIRDRWIPRLERALAEVTFAIEEQERADAARLRLAAGTPSPASPAG
jgi:V/A-type H+-transporting ATPase subunit D